MRRYTVSIDDQSYTIDVLETAADRFEVSVGDRTFEATLEGEADLPGAVISPQLAVAEEARSTAAPRVPAQAAAAQAAPPRPAGVPIGVETLAAPMPGVVLEVLVVPGAAVRRGDPILVLEAMKMRNTIRSPRDAVVVDVLVEAGRPVGPGEPLVRLGAAGE